MDKSSYNKIPRRILVEFAPGSRWIAKRVEIYEYLTIKRIERKTNGENILKSTAFNIYFEEIGSSFPPKMLKKKYVKIPQKGINLVRKRDKPG